MVVSISAGHRAFGPDELVTGEAVSVELPVAGVVHRLASGAIDATLSLVVLVGATIAASLTLGGTSGAVVQTVLILIVVGSLVGLPVAIETSTRGRTLGKLALGLRTVRDDGGPIRFRHAVVRALVGFVEIWMVMGLPAFVSALISARGKRLGDFAAGTYVITTRQSGAMAAPPSMPIALEPWARSADIAALPHGLGIAVRQFLTRRTSLSDGARDELARHLTRAVLPYLSPPPPPAPREEVLAAVLAERRRRDTTRLDRERRLRQRFISRDPLADDR